MSRRAVVPAAIAAAVLAVTAAAAYATTVTGTQNPQLRVTVSITPTHPVVGDTIVARETITNTTGRTLHGRFSAAFSTPREGIGFEAIGGLPPGRIDTQTFRRKVTATSPRGTYTMYAAASDGRGRSHARVQITVR